MSTTENNKLPSFKELVKDFSTTELNSAMHEGPRAGLIDNANIPKQFTTSAPRGMEVPPLLAQNNTVFHLNNGVSAASGFFRPYSGENRGGPPPMDNYLRLGERNGPLMRDSHQYPLRRSGSISSWESYGYSTYGSMPSRGSYGPNLSNIRGSISSDTTDQSLPVRPLVSRPASYPVVKFPKRKASEDDISSKIPPYLTVETEVGRENLLKYLEAYSSISKRSLTFGKFYDQMYKKFTSGDREITKDDMISLLKSFEVSILDNQVTVHQQGDELLKMLKVFAQSASFTETKARRKSHPQMNGEKKKGHGKSLSLGGLNKDLSQKPDVSCQHCGSKDTPEWRRGPTGSRSLCNACGLFYSKLMRKTGIDGAYRIMSERKAAGCVKDRRVR